MINFWNTMDLKLKMTDEDVESKIQDIKKMHPELAVCELELRTFFTKPLPLITVLDVSTICNANSCERTASIILKMPEIILPEVQLAILNIATCVAQKNKESLNIELLKFNKMTEAMEKYLKEYLDKNNIELKIPEVPLKRTPRVIHLSYNGPFSFGHGGNCEIEEWSGLIVNEQ